MLKQIFAPFGRTNKQIFIGLAISQAILALVLWHIGSNGLIPKPINVVNAFINLLTSKNLIDNILISVMLTRKAMGI